MQTRAAFLSDPTRIVFHYTPLHSSWLNQIEIWFSILVRKLLRRASFSSKADLKTRILDFIDYFNHTMAKPLSGLTRASYWLCSTSISPCCTRAELTKLSMLVGEPIRSNSAPPSM